MTSTARTLLSIFEQAFSETEADRIVRLLGDFVKEKVREDVLEVAKAAESHIGKRIERSLSSEIKHVATKEDVAALRGEFRAEMKDQKAEIIKWMIAILIAQTALLITILK